MRVDPGFEELYRREQAAVFRAVSRLCGDRAVAEDATQEAFARALARWRRLRGRTWAAGWVTTTALNLARRSLQRMPPSDGPVVTEEPDPGAAVDLWRAVRTLPGRQQEAVVLRYALDLPVAEVAAAMGCAEGTAKAHLARARDSLRDQLEGARDE